MGVLDNPLCRKVAGRNNEKKRSGSPRLEHCKPSGVLKKKIGELPHRRTKWSPQAQWRPGGVCEFARVCRSEEAGQALGASGCHRLRECKCLHNTIQRRLDGIEARGCLKAQLQAFEQTGCLEGEDSLRPSEVWFGRYGATLTERCEQSHFHPKPHSSPSQRWVCP